MVVVLSTNQWHVGQFLSYPQMPYYSCILPSVFVNGAPHALVAKIESNQSQEWEATLFRGPTFLPRVQVPMEGQ